MTEIYTQLDIFSYLQSIGEDFGNRRTAYCWDSDINEIHSKLLALAEKNHLLISEDEFTIWAHVPQYGFRLYLTMRVTRKILQDIRFLRDIDEITEYAKKQNVELSCMIGACYFFQGQDTARLSFSTMFIDRARQKKTMKEYCSTHGMSQCL